MKTFGIALVVAVAQAAVHMDYNTPQLSFEQVRLINEYIDNMEGKARTLSEDDLAFIGDLIDDNSFDILADYAQFIQTTRQQKTMGAKGGNPFANLISAGGSCNKTEGCSGKIAGQEWTHDDIINGTIYEPAPQPAPQPAQEPINSTSPLGAINLASSAILAAAGALALVIA